MTNDIELIRHQMLPSQLGKIKDIDPQKAKELKDACAGFEAILTKKMFESMRQTLPGDALFNQSNGMEIFESMYDQYLTDEVSHAPHGTGIKEFLYEQLKGSL